MTVQELNPEQYNELCARYITEFWTDLVDGTSAPSYYDLVHANELVSEDVIFRYYDGMIFTKDDFFCSKEE